MCIRNDSAFFKRNITPLFGFHGHGGLGFVDDVLGTGLGSLVHEITDKYEINYSEIPNFPVSTVEGHSGKLIFGKLGNKDITKPDHLQSFT